MTEPYHSDIPHYQFTLSDVHAMLGIPDPRPDWMR